MRKLLSWMLIIAMMCMCTAAFATEAEDTEEEIQLPMLYTVDPIEDLVGFQPGTELTIATTTEMAGYFATDMWGNNTADMDVRALLHGYATVAWIRTLGMALDGVPINDIQIQELPNGGRVYTFNLNQDLVYNDGSPITAKDYLFSVLLSGATQLSDIGEGLVSGEPRDLDHIAGYLAYRNGESTVLSGLRLLNDNSFSIEISGTYLPYFYGLAMLNITPYPMAVIAPGCDIADDGAGAYITGDFTSELLQKTLLDPETGYVFNPRVTSGPYQLESYDAATHTAVFTANQRYLGNFEGKKPSIEKIIFTSAANADMAKLIQNGDVDIVHKVVDQQAYLELISLVQTGDIGLPLNYPRSGFGFIAFACEEGPTASTAVRNAIARAIDKEEFVASTFVDSLALPVYGYYGLGQWMIGQTMEVNGEVLTMSEILEASGMAKDLEESKKMLADDGWNLNAQGAKYVEGTDAVRYRKAQDGTPEALAINWAKIKDNATADSIRALVEPAFKELGIELTITEMTLSEMLPYYYRQTDRTYNMFNLASNFTYVFDPYYDFHTEENYHGLVNSSGLADEKLMALAWDLRRTDAKDMEGYVTKWLAFQQRWIEMMPMVPLYSNVYFDFVANDVQGYAVQNFSTWSLAVPYTYIADEPIVPEVPEDELADAEVELLP